MQEDDFRVIHDDELTKVGLENEFLTLEVEVLRAKLSDIDALLAEKDAVIVDRNRMVSEKNSVIAQRNATVGKRDRTIAELRSRLQQVIERREEQVVIDRQVYEELKQARRDLRWTLNRLSKTPLLGPLISRRAGFARLTDEYLRE